MLELIKIIRKSVIGGLFFSLTVIFSFFVFASSSFSPWGGDVINGGNLTSTMWNQMQDNQTYLKNQVDSMSSGGGMKNLIINGAFRINERGAGSKTQNTNSYNYDRWYWDGSYLIQFIEDKNVVKSGTYTLSWEGTANARVNGSSISNGGQVTLTANTQVRVDFDSSNVNYVQLEYGNTATNFEIRPYSLELSLSQRYYEKIIIGGGVVGLGQNYQTRRRIGSFSFNTTKRVNPSMGNVVVGVDGCDCAPTFTLSTNVNSFYGHDSSGMTVAGSTVSGDTHNGFIAYADAEIYP